MAQIDIFCLVVDLSNKEGLANLRYWVAMIDANATISPYVLIIGNKCDIKALSYQEIGRAAREHNLPYMEVSSFNHENVRSTFDAILRWKLMSTQGSSQTIIKSQNAKIKPQTKAQPNSPIDELSEGDMACVNYSEDMFEENVSAQKVSDEKYEIYPSARARRDIEMQFAKIRCRHCSCFY